MNRYIDSEESIDIDGPTKEQLEKERLEKQECDRKLSFIYLDMCEQQNLIPNYTRPKITAPKSQTPIFNRRPTIDRNIEIKWEEIWKNERMNMDIQIGIDRYHSCYTNDCKINGDIVERSRDVFQCMKSGKVHVCSYHTVCHEALQTSEGLTVCCISGYDRGEKEEADFDISGHFNMRKFNNSRNRNTKPICSESGVRSYAQPKFKVTKNKQSPQMTSPLFKMSSQSGNKDTTSRNKGITNKNNTPSPTNKQSIDICPIFNSITNEILYDGTIRNNINNKRLFEINRKCKAATKRYVEQCKETNSLPNAITLWSIVQCLTRREVLMEIVVRRDDVYNNYKEICNYLWLIYLDLNQYRNNTKTQAIKFVFGFLYLVKDVCTEDNNNYSISRNLPLQNEIQLFSKNYQTSLITQGNKIVKNLIIDLNNQDVVSVRVDWLMHSIEECIDSCPVDISSLKSLFE